LEADDDGRAAPAAVADLRCGGVVGGD